MLKRHHAMEKTPSRRIRITVEPPSVEMFNPRHKRHRPVKKKGPASLVLKLKKAKQAPVAEPSYSESNQTTNFVDMTDEYKMFEEIIQNAPVIDNAPAPSPPKTTPNMFHDSDEESDDNDDAPPIQNNYMPIVSNLNDSIIDFFPQNIFSNTLHIPPLDNQQQEIEEARVFCMQQNQDRQQAEPYQMMVLPEHKTDSPDNAHLVGQFIDFVSNMRPQVNDIVNDIAHCRTYKEKEREKMPQHSQSRVIGSVTMLNKLPDEMKSCPCNCSTRNISSEKDPHTLLGLFVERDWLRDNERLQLFIPSYTQIDCRHAPAVIGTFKTNNGNYKFVDASSLEEHCCPVSWFYSTFLLLCATGKIPDVATVGEHVREQIKVKSNCFRFVVVQELNVTLFQMAANYRHDIGMTDKNINNNNDDDAISSVGGRRGKNPRRNKIECSDNVVFKTRQQLSDFFKPVNIPPYPELNLWMQAQNHRIMHLENLIQGYKAALANNQ